MEFKKKAALLSVLVFILSVIYILTFVFDGEGRNYKTFAWLPSEFFFLADTVEIYGVRGNTVLSRENDAWIIKNGDEKYPVKRGRVNDLFAALALTDVYSLRAASADAENRLVLTEQGASRIVIRGGAGLPLLDLLIGISNAFGGEVFLRKADEKNIYSGKDRFTLFTDSGSAFWYELRLFPAGTSSGFPLVPYSNDGIGASEVQQAEIRISRNGDAFTLSRNGTDWLFFGHDGGVDNLKAEAWLRSAVLEASAVAFSAAPPSVVEKSITLRLGNGKTILIQAGAEDENKNRILSVSGSALYYTVSRNTANRLFRESSWFLKTSQE